MIHKTEWQIISLNFSRALWYMLISIQSSALHKNYVIKLYKPSWNKKYTQISKDLSNLHYKILIHVFNSLKKIMEQKSESITTLKRSCLKGNSKSSPKILNSITLFEKNLSKNLAKLSMISKNLQHVNITRKNFWASLNKKKN